MSGNPYSYDVEEAHAIVHNTIKYANNRFDPNIGKTKK